jgi:2Fe-2S ferredoxin
MTTIQVIRRNGSLAQIEAAQALSLMENLRRSGIDDIIALCGGNRSCATCHVYIDDQSGLGEMTKDEADMLSCLIHQRDQSRLSCQVLIHAVDYLRVEIAPEE